MYIFKFLSLLTIFAYFLLINWQETLRQLTFTNEINVDLKIHLNGIILEVLFQDDVQTAHFAYNF